MNKQNFQFFHRQKVWSRQLLAFAQQLMRFKASTAVIPWPLLRGCKMAVPILGMMPNQGRKKGEGQNQLQLSLCIRKAKASPPPPFQLNPTQILLARLDHTVTPTCRGSWESEQTFWSL